MDYVTTSQAAAELNITPEGVLKLISRGVLPAQKVGRDWIIHRKDVQKAKKRPGRGRPKKPEEGK